MEIQRLDQEGKVRQEFYEYALQCCKENKEIWVDIEGYEGMYQVSNMGRVKSLERIIIDDKCTRIFKGKILEPNVNRGGYKYVSLSKEGKTKTKNIHKIESIAFLFNPENKNVVNHDDGIKTNCFLTNLICSTSGENNAHSFRTGLKKPTYLGKFGKDHFNSKKILQLDINGSIIKIFDSGREAAKELNINKTNICMCLKGKRNYAGGFKWVYEQKVA